MESIYCCTWCCHVFASRMIFSREMSARLLICWLLLCNSSAHVFLGLPCLFFSFLIRLMVCSEKMQLLMTDSSGIRAIFPNKYSWRCNNMRLKDLELNWARMNLLLTLLIKLGLIFNMWRKHLHPFGVKRIFRPRWHLSLCAVCVFGVCGCFSCCVCPDRRISKLYFSLVRCSGHWRDELMKNMT